MVRPQTNAGMLKCRSALGLLAMWVETPVHVNERIKNYVLVLSSGLIKNLQAHAKWLSVTRFCLTPNGITFLYTACCGMSKNLRICSSLVSS